MPESPISIPNRTLWRRLLHSPSFWLLLGGFLLYLPWMARSFNALEINAGCYLGTFVNNYERLGFWHVLGAQLGMTGLDLENLAERGVVYFHHPPGASWFIYMFGTAEWQIRLSTMTCAVFLAIGVYHLLRRYLDAWGAVASAILMLVAPVLFVHCQGSFQHIIMLPAVIMLLLLDESRRQGSIAWPKQLALALVIFVGTWLDWDFVFFCLAAVPLAVAGSFGSILRRLATPIVAGLAAVGSNLWWRAQVEASEHLPKIPPGDSILDLVDSSILANRPSLGESFTATGKLMLEGYTWPGVLVMALGSFILLRRYPRLTLALLLPGLHLLVFANHALTHTINYAYLALFVVAACGALICALPGSRPLWSKGLVTLALATCMAGSSIRLMVATDTNFFRDMGQTLTRATGDSSQNGAADKRYLVVHSGRIFSYYVNSPRVHFPAVTDPAFFKNYMGMLPADRGLRFLWLKIDGDPVLEKVSRQQEQAMDAYLAPFPRERVQELELSFDAFGTGFPITVREAWLVTIREPEI